MIITIDLGRRIAGGPALSDKQVSALKSLLMPGEAILAIYPIRDRHGVLCDYADIGMSRKNTCTSMMDVARLSAYAYCVSQLVAP